MSFYEDIGILGPIQSLKEERVLSNQEHFSMAGKFD